MSAPSTTCSARADRRTGLISIFARHNTDSLASRSHTRKRPSGVPDGLSCLTAAAHCRAISEPPCQGAYFPSQVLIGIRCLSGQSRSLVPEPTRWFPISVRWPYQAASTRRRQGRAACCPRCSRNPQGDGATQTARRNRMRPSVSRRPGLVIAGRLGPVAARQCRA